MKLYQYGHWTRISIVTPNARYAVEATFWKKGWLEKDEILNNYPTKTYEEIEIDYFDNGERPSIGWFGMPK